MENITRVVKNAEQEIEAKVQTISDHVEGKQSSETLNKIKIKIDDVVEDIKREV